MTAMPVFELDVNGIKQHVALTDRQVNARYTPMVEELLNRARAKAGPIILVIAGVPGVGKSHYAAIASLLLAQHGLKSAALSIDGFHYSNEYLRTHSLNGAPLSSIKGAPQTYDTAALRSALAELGRAECHWPYYDRTLHEPVDAIAAPNLDVYLIEGNWLLLRGYGWDIELPENSLTLFMDAPDHLLIERLTARKVRGGMSEADAREFVMRSDMANVRLCRSASRRADRYITIKS